MALTTHGVPYPLPDEPVAEGAARIRDVAEALEAKVLNGRLDWGPAGAPDASLSRSAPYTIHVGDLLEVNQGVSIGVGANAYLSLKQDDGSIFFGVNGDAKVYRGGANLLRTDGSFETPRVTIRGDGAGGDIILGGDTNVYRGGANLLRTDGSLWTGGSVLALGAGYVAGAYGGAGQVSIGANGPGGAAAVVFGSAADANVYRAAAGQLKTDGVLIAGQELYARLGSAWQVMTGYVNGNAGILFGGAQDANLYRAGAGALKTDGALVASSFGVPSGSPGGWLDLGQVGALPGAPGAAGGRLYVTFAGGKNALAVVWPDGTRTTIATQP